MDLSTALSFTCTDHFLQVHPLFNDVMQPMKIVTSHASIQPNTNEYASWMAKDAQWFTILKHNQQTIVYCHSNNMMYYASPNIQLHPHMPEGYAFLAQTCIDNNETPRMLILDMILPSIDDPKHRGEILRGLSQFFPTTCHIQWAGDITALRKFLKNGLPHPVECVISLQKPLHIIREHILQT